MAQTEEMTTEQAEQKDSNKAVAQAAEFSEAVDTGAASGENLDILLDIQMPVTVILGKTEIPLASTGSILSYDQLS